MSQEGFTAAIPTQLEFLIDLGFGRLGQGFTIKAGGLGVSGSFQLTQALLVIIPFISKQLSTTHATNWNNHFTLWGGFEK